MGDALLAHDARAGRLQPRLNTRIVLATTLGFSPAAGSNNADAQGPEGREADGAAARRLQRFASAAPGTAKGMILTVATMSPGATARNGASVRR